MEAWLSWLEHTVHIREVTGSSPVASTTVYQSAPVADCFFISVLATKLECASRTAHGVRPVTNGHTARSASDCMQSRSADERVLLPPPHFINPHQCGLFFIFLYFFKISIKLWLGCKKNNFSYFTYFFTLKRL